MCFQLETRIARDSTLLISWKWIKILNQEITVKAQPIRFQWEWQRAEKNQANATNVRMHHITQAIWGNIWKPTVEKRQTNATNAISHLFRQEIWGDIWKHTIAEESQSNATNAMLYHPLMQEIGENICKHTLAKGKTNATSVIKNRPFYSKLKKHRKKESDTKKSNFHPQFKSWAVKMMKMQSIPNVPLIKKQKYKEHLVRIYHVVKRVLWYDVLVIVELRWSQTMRGAFGSNLFGI